MQIKNKSLEKIIKKLDRIAPNIIASAILIGVVGYSVKECSVSEKISYAKVTNVEIIDFYDGETGYQEYIHEIKIDQYDNCLIDKSKTVKKDQTIYSLVIKHIPFPFACDRLEDYKK